ncbi:MAG: MFS transporter, partial [Candidatus Limnocylindria bacterium]
VSVALGSVAYIAAWTVASLAAPEITGSASSSGLPSSVAVAGTALAAALLSGLMARRGRRIGIMAGIAVGLCGSAALAISIIVASFPLMLAGALALGFANSAVQLSRYAAADLYPHGGQASALSFVVWGNTLGAVIGPNLVAPAGSLGEAVGVSPFTSGFLLVVVLLLVALGTATFGPRAPGEVEPVQPASVRTPTRRLLAELLRLPRGRTAVTALASVQLVMVLVMTMTPYHLHESGHGLGTVGFVLSAHTLGMFAFAPISGRLTDRLGALPMIMAGFAVLTSAGVLAALLPTAAGSLLAIPLFLLGVGWNLGFVAGSSLLASGAPLSVRARLQGATDAVVWSISALAGAASGFVVELAGFSALSLVGAGAAALLAAVIAADRRTLRSVEA